MSSVKPSQAVQHRREIAIIAFLLFGIFTAVPAMAAIPPSENAKIPPQAEKGIDTANAAKENHGQSGDHRPAVVPLPDMDNPLSATESQGENMGKGATMNKGQNAVTVLARVAAKKPEGSKAREMILRNRERIAAKVAGRTAG